MNEIVLCLIDEKSFLSQFLKNTNLINIKLLAIIFYWETRNNCIAKIDRYSYLLELQTKNRNHVMTINQNVKLIIAIWKWLWEQKKYSLTTAQKNRIGLKLKANSIQI